MPGPFTRPTVGVFRTGDWTMTRMRFNGLAYKLQNAVDMAGRAQESANRLKENLRNGTYETEAGWPPLSDKYAERKDEQGYGEKPILIKTEEYVEAIHVKHLGLNQYAIAIDDPRLAQIGLVQEYGTDVGAKHPVPARPHWRIELMRLESKLPVGIAEALGRVLSGRMVTSPAVVIGNTGGSE